MQTATGKVLFNGLDLGESRRRHVMHRAHRCPSKLHHDLVGRDDANFAHAIVERRGLVAQGAQEVKQPDVTSRQDGCVDRRSGRIDR